MTLLAYQFGALPAPPISETSFTMALAGFAQLLQIDLTSPPPCLPAPDSGTLVSDAYELGSGYPEGFRVSRLNLPLRVGLRLFRGDVQTRAGALREYARNNAGSSDNAVKAALLSALHFASFGGEEERDRTVEMLALARNQAMRNCPDEAVCVAVAMKRGGDWLAGEGGCRLAEAFYIASAELMASVFTSGYCGRLLGDDAALRLAIDMAHFGGMAGFLGRDWQMSEELLARSADIVFRRTHSATRENRFLTGLLRPAVEAYTRAAYISGAMFASEEKALGYMLRAAYLLRKGVALESGLPAAADEAILSNLMEGVIAPFGGGAGGTTDS